MLADIGIIDFETIIAMLLSIVISTMLSHVLCFFVLFLVITAMERIISRVIFTIIFIVIFSPFLFVLIVVAPPLPLFFAIFFLFFGVVRAFSSIILLRVVAMIIFALRGVLYPHNISSSFFFMAVFFNQQ